MKKYVVRIAAVMLVLASLVIASFPLISNYLNSLNADSEIVHYTESAEQLKDDDYSEILAEAQKYNEKLLYSYSGVSDPFAQKDVLSDEYKSMLNINGNDVMATLEIPSINVSLPIHYGTSDGVLKKGIGHLASSSLPIGGKGTHSVLTGHTGYSVFKLFSDLNKLEQGDVFFLHTLKDTLAYEVDNISVVLPTETDLLQIESDKDYVTLVTCTPFGINSHRLLVRGTRIEYSGDMSDIKESHITDSTWNSEYFQAIVLGIAAMILILIVFAVVRLILFMLKRTDDKK